MHGVQALDGAVIDVQDCELSSNHKSGISCNDLHSLVKVDSSVISTNDDAAVDVDYAAKVNVHDCVLHGNDMFGVRVNGEQTEVTLTSNEIHENEIGVWGWRGAVISVADNSITHNLRSDFEIEVGCLPPPFAPCRNECFASSNPLCLWFW